MDFEFKSVLAAVCCTKKGLPSLIPMAIPHSVSKIRLKIFLLESSKPSAKFAILGIIVVKALFLYERYLFTRCL